MVNRSTSAHDLKRSAVRIVVLHDDHLTAARGTLVARNIADDMGLGAAREMKMWNVDLLDSEFARSAAIDTSNADLLIVALRSTTGFSMGLKLWLRRWLLQTKHSSAALIAVFETSDASAVREGRAFIERSARSSGKDFFSESVDLGSSGGAAEPHEFLWVL